MDGQLSKVILDGLDAARFSGTERDGNFRVVAGGRSYPVLRMWKTGFALSVGDAPHLRGLVEVYEGQAYILMGLVVANAPQDGEIIYEFKRATHVTDRPPLDFVVAAEGAAEGIHVDGNAL